MSFRRASAKPAGAICALVQLHLLLFSSHAGATDQTAADCSYAAVDSAITACIDTGGGVVHIPPCVTTDWGTDKIAIDTSTPLKILGAGKDVTQLAASGNYLFRISGDGLTEIGGFTVDLGGVGGMAITLESPDKATETIIHDIKALNSAGSPFVLCQSAHKPLLLYNMDIRNSKTYGIYVYGPGPLWAYSIPEPNWGVANPNVCFIEDSFFYQNGGHAISGFTGSKIVIRHNTFDDMLDTGLDGHAWGYGQSCGQRSADPRDHANNYGAYQFEIYDNVWENTSARYCMRIRSGTAMITDNVCDANETVRLAIESRFDSGYDPDEVTGTDSNTYTCIEPHIAADANRPITGANWSTYWKLAGTTGGTWSLGETYYPFISSQSDCRVSVDAPREFWQVIQGDSEIYGADGKLSKAPVAYNIPHQWWIWNNTSAGTLLAKEDGPGCLTQGVTYWLRAPQPGDPVESYTKYAYPHPLRSGTIDPGLDGAGFSDGTGGPDGAGGSDGIGGPDGGNKGADTGSSDDPSTGGDGCGCSVQQHAHLRYVLFLFLVLWCRRKRRG
jgi:hypothetical protein